MTAASTAPSRTTFPTKHFQTAASPNAVNSSTSSISTDLKNRSIWNSDQSGPPPPHVIVNPKAVHILSLVHPRILLVTGKSGRYDFGGMGTVQADYRDCKFKYVRTTEELALLKPLDKGLSGGVIAGIVVAVVVFLGLLGGRFIM
ncbi:hypothetical protein BC829DRAFT_417576 [Chytridium lagenaria]|nr:hypothetical protein BC829DRAFT_417576 [Chytridium lagenaria]